MDDDLRRARLVAGLAEISVEPLVGEALESIAWSGSTAHLENVAMQLERVATGEVEYLVVLADGHAVSKGGIDFAKEAGAGTIWQVATHPALEGLGLATRLIVELEGRAARRGVAHLRLAVEPENQRALGLYEHLGYHRIGTSEASWQAERSDGSRFTYRTTLIEMAKLT
jgi:ribosomal protein S18 acetylase RimI-like enzyme